MLLDQTISRLDRKGRIVGVWLGARHYVSDLGESTLDAFESSTDFSVTDLVDAEVGEAVLGAIERCLTTGETQSIEYTTRATGRLLHLEGSCAPCGDDDVIWITRDRTEDHKARRVAESRADLEALISDSLQDLIEVGDDSDALDETLATVMQRVATFFDAQGAFLRRFRGQDRVEIVTQWREPELSYAPPGTSRAGAEDFPWASRELARDPVLIVPNLRELGATAAVDVSNLRDVDDRGLVWIRIGPRRRPTGVFGLTFPGAPAVRRRETYQPLIGFAATILAIALRVVDHARQRAQRRVLEAVARGATLSEVLGEVCRLRETGVSGQHCVIWTLGADGELHPTASPSSGIDLDRFDPCPDGAPELDAFRSGRPAWLLEDAGRVGSGAVAEHIGANATELTPLVTGGEAGVVGVMAVYDTSRQPVAPESDDAEGWGDLAASLAGVAIERIRNVADLSHRASHDSLTGLLNCEAFIERLDAAIARSGPVDRLVAVLYCDVDRFKELNDRLGHTHGDRFLVDAARRIREATGPEAIEARLGGDEFAILLEGLADENDAMIVAERIRTAIGTSSTEPGKTSSVSVGVAVSGSSADHAEGLLRDADIAMYQAKSFGRNRVELFAEGIRQQARARDRLAQDLVGALDSGHIEVHYQPMLDVIAGELRGFEALARWRYGSNGFVPPSEFIPIAEAAGLIGRLGDEVLDQSLRVASTWRGLDLHVNLSARQIDTIGYVESLLDRIKRSRVPVDRVAMEITESVLLSDSAATIENLHRLTDSGVGLVLDDFGTGYASLTYLRRFPFRGIKVDRSFVSGIDGNADDAAIVSMVLALATSLGLEVIAEGVETVGQERRLREMGCRFVQGFRYSLPVPAAGVAGLVERSWATDPAG